MGKKISRWTGSVALCVAALLGGCGGGGDSGSADVAVPSNLEGLYAGSLTPGRDSNVRFLVLETGETWGLYGSETGGVLLVSGLVQGNGVSQNGTFTTSNLKDFGTGPTAPLTLSGAYNNTAGTFSGSIVTSSRGTLSINTTQIGGINYNYNTPANLSSVSGAWTLTDLVGDKLALNVQSSGNLTLTYPGSSCVLIGTISPRSSGKNVFDVLITPGPAPCNNSSLRFVGVALSYPVNGRPQLLIAAVDSTRTFGLPLFGTR